MTTTTTTGSFDLHAALPTGPTTTVLEASAGTGKTYALAALVTRYVAEGQAQLDEMLLITFSRAASQELRERVRDQLVKAAEALDDPRKADDELLELLVAGTDAEREQRRLRLRDALAGFDAATIATTHQFCQLVLRSLGVAGDTDAGVTLVENLDDLVAEVVDDLYLQRFGDVKGDPELTRAQALELAHEVVGNPRTRLTPVDPPPDSTAGVRRAFADEVSRELERRKRLLGVLGFDDLLSRLAVALEADDAPARDRMRRRWSIVMVDEFQDTDPVQWEVIERAFVGQVTLVLIGDPKQAIYAFRGGDVVTYLRARERADALLTLDTNYRSDAPLVRRLLRVLDGAALGHEDIVVRPVDAHRTQHRLAGAPCNDPFRLRVVSRESFRMRGTRTIPMDDLRPFIARDLAADVKALLASDATYDDRPIRARDVAVIVESHRDARACRDALAAAGVPAVYTGDTDVFASQAAADWQCLLEAFEQPGRAGLVRAAAATMFFGRTATELATDPELTDDVSDTLRRWADYVRARGIAAVLEAAYVAGMAERVLAWRGGERHLTDVEHLTQLLHETAHRDGLGLPAMLQWLRAQRQERAGAAERNRRLDSDAAAVQIMTVWVSKGLQYPLVYLPFAFNRNVRMGEAVLYHEPDGTRCLDIGGSSGAGYAAVTAKGRAEMAGDDIRLTYVALTRAQSQVVTWWAPSWDEVNGGLSRLLRGRVLGQAAVPDSLPAKVDDASALDHFRKWEAAGGPHLEPAAPATDVPEPPLPKAPRGLGVRAFDRPIDVDWRRTSYSALIRAADEAGGVTSEPELSARDDELADELADETEVAPEPVADSPATLPSPMAALPSGAAFGSLVHGVLEVADPSAPDLEAELLRHVQEQRVWWPVDTPAEELAAALVPLHQTSLGPLAGGLTLGELGLSDRLCELDFEIPLAGGDVTRGVDVTLDDVGALLAQHLGADDPLRPYADRLRTPGLGSQSLRGYLSGSIDVVLRVPGPRYVVVDYKTNWLGPADQPLTAAAYSRERLVEAMLHSDYPLQALLYVVVAHRYLRWRQPGYDPAQHLAGVLYLYVRGMCGPDTPEEDGHPAGVFSWQPPVPLVIALSDLLDGVS
ncbi:MAG TPA: UvrD-helicase domain-containing protein [Nocardioides sp.]|uniref:UvrD-helicase domain-containing protein n=1 Tax=Nocardioides sp. TaxID=35761 RepID=UPI002E3411F0|nr:UvrD-helicase domain-containing protein [Nocardioides sp.]HEX5090223.1 UvrD-helicase domain-containing protein [Nocardioides sp.]